MRGFTTIGVAALALAACRQTVVFDQTGFDGGGGGSGGGVGGGSGGSRSCTGQPVEVSPESPALVVALDRSSGMSSKFGDTTQVAAARAALEEHALRYQNAVRFGYIDFPGSVNCTMTGGYCCAGELRPPGPNVQSFRNALHTCDQNPSCSFSGNLRPTPSAIRSSAGAFNTSNGIRGYMLLITNGRPDCESGTNPACTEAQTMIGQLASPPLYVPTFVVAPGPVVPEDVDCLTGLAFAGDVPAGREPYYYGAANPGELSGTIDDIMHAVARDACYLDVLSGPIQNADKAAVYWGNIEIPHNRDGWELAQQGREIALRGEWCERLIQEGKAALAVFPICNPAGF